MDLNDDNGDAGVRDHYLCSSLREQILEHIFISELLKAMWRMGYRDMEVLRSEVDNAGYDIVVAHRGIMRHIQLKASHATAHTSHQKIHLALAEKRSGCVIWLRFDPETLALGPYLWLGARPGEPLPDIRGLPIAKHTKANAQGEKKGRPNLRLVPKRAFTQLGSIDDVVATLFGLRRAAR
jgi:hypothetical protein